MVTFPVGVFATGSSGPYGFLHFLKPSPLCGRRNGTMIWNMPIDSFIFYIAVFFVQFVLVVGYGVWWALQKDEKDSKQ